MLIHTRSMGGVHLHACTLSCTPVLYLDNGWTDCAEIWCVVGDSLATRFAHPKGGEGKSARAHVRTPFSYVRNGWTDCVEIWYVAWLGAQ